MRRFASILCAALLISGAPAAAQSSALAQAIAAGEVGERFDGYMGYVGTPSPEVRRQVSAINLQRRNLYIELSLRRNVSPQLVGTATACQLFAQLPVGEAYMLNDGAWRRRAPGQPAPLPNDCR
jgi:uncharacterized protein YdbL (DUF1318 family)